MASGDNSHLYLITSSYLAHFEIYNIDRDSIEFDFQLQTPVANITITPDGKYVIYDEGENVVNFEDPPSPRTISVYDIMARQMKTIIPTFGVLPDNMDGSPAG